MLELRGDGIHVAAWHLEIVLSSVGYSETLNKEYIEQIHQMSYSSLSDNGMLQISSFF